VPADVLQIEAPRTPEQPLPEKVNGRSNGPVDLFRTMDQYRLDIKADQIVPFLDIYAEAPTARAAGQLVNGAVDGLNDYLRAMAKAQGTPPNQQATIRQFGRAQGQLLIHGIQWQVALIVFCVVLAVASAVVVALGRIRRGWSAGSASAASWEPRVWNSSRF
jgi:hypothetical protein